MFAKLQQMWPLAVLMVALVKAAPTPGTAAKLTNLPGPASMPQLNLKWTPRSSWLAAPAHHITPINGEAGVPYVIIHHTAVPRACHSAANCRAAVRAIQRSHQQDRAWDDIGYNFLIGGGNGDGEAEIYEGRGFNVSGAHAAGYNGRSVGIVLIGDWSDALPPRAMLDKLKQLINYGVQMGHIQRNYTLLGHRQVKGTLCPGTRLYNEIKQWPHFSTQPNEEIKGNK